VVACSEDRGAPGASMGMAAAAYDGGIWTAIWVTNFEGQNHFLYRNVRSNAQTLDHMFMYQTRVAGIAVLGQHYVGWGTAFIDLDNDGWEDLVVCNGHAYRHPAKSTRRQRPVLLRNSGATGGSGRAQFVEFAGRGGPYFQTEHDGRGLAVGDFDNDGRPDLAISHLNEPIAILRNENASPHHWLGVELHGKSHRDLVGARLTLEVDGRRLTRFMVNGGSYMSACEPPH